MKRARHPEAGFTMLELLVTLAITVFGLMGMIAAHRSLARGAASSAQAQEAVAIGTQVVETLRGARPDVLASAVTGGDASPPYENPTFATVLGRNGVPYSAAVEVIAVSSSLWRIRVEVSWTDDAEGRRRTLPLELLRTAREAL